MSYKEKIMREIENEKVEKPASPRMEKMEPKPKEGTVIKNDFVRLRKYPSLETGEVAAVLRNGSKLTILGEHGDFYKVKLDHYQHPLYILKEFCKLN